MDKKFQISVVIPTYNRRPLIGRAIQSVINQTYKLEEIIVVDDGSNDGSREYIEKNFPSVQYIGQSNQGVSTARNSGLRMASSDWIAFLDSDDEWFPDKIEKQVSRLKKYPEFKFCHSNEIWIRNNSEIKQNKTQQKFEGYIFEHCLDKCRISPSTVLIHKSILDSVGYFDESLFVCEDYEFWLRITAIYPVLLIKKPLIKKYAGHGNQLSTVKGGIEFHHIRVLEKLLTMDFNFYQSRSMTKMLIKKLTIFAKGALRRGRNETFSRSMKRIDELSSML